MHFLRRSHDIADKDYGPCLKCSLHYFVTNLLSSTPADIFLFLQPQHLQSVLAMPWVSSAPHLHILTLDPVSH